MRDPSHPVAPNVLARDFTATVPNERWVTDITYIWTDEGWAYLAVILDLFSRASSAGPSTSLSTRLPLAALDVGHAAAPARSGLVHHSDRGCQYTSTDYRDAPRRARITVSMSRKGNCWDNAVTESFFATLKKELVYEPPLANRLELRAALFEYIEVFYNRQPPTLVPRLQDTSGRSRESTPEARLTRVNGTGGTPPTRHPCA